MDVNPSLSTGTELIPQHVRNALFLEMPYFGQKLEVRSWELVIITDLATF